MSRRLRPFLFSSTVVLVGFAGVALAQSSATPAKTQDRLPVQAETAAAGPFRQHPADRPGAGSARPGMQVAAIDAGPFGIGPEPRPPQPGAGPQFAFGPPGAPPPDAPRGDFEDDGPEAMPFPPPFPPAFPGQPGPGMWGRGGPMDASRPRPPGERGRGGPEGPLAYAATLAAAETALGIQAGQMDAWRAFTDALQAVAIPAPPPPPPQAGAEPHHAGTEPPQPGAEPPSPIAALAARLTAQGEAGTRLSQASQALRAKLRPDQLARLAALEPQLLPHGGPRRPPPPPHRAEAGGPGRSGDGPPAPAAEGRPGSGRR